ncbi:MAG: hypothetical protein VXW63_02030 [Chloroflexota bacterium]|jgi:hypothetical protein|nr:hypothetical protein [Chloroflexota bacterium]MEC8440363.1 hypothetical protein [Chloroflexota bacterium]|tara:strand:- start:929 stop:1405 length:477 start_codon:yes stop_codon:yes gene_type:complete
MKFIKNNLLLLTSIAFVFASILISISIIFQPFNSSSDLYVSGRTLFIKLNQPEQLQEYSNNSNKIIFINTEVINAASGEILLLINDQSVDLLSKDGFTYKPLNPSEIDFNIQKPLWGSFNLSRNQMVKGNLFFKVNKTFEPQTFEWKESDRVIINFSQ